MAGSGANIARTAEATVDAHDDLRVQCKTVADEPEILPVSLPHVPMAGSGPWERHAPAWMKKGTKSDG